jgi:hypothetical protein
LRLEIRIATVALLAQHLPSPAGSALARPGVVCAVYLGGASTSRPEPTLFDASNLGYERSGVTVRYGQVQRIVPDLFGEIFLW